MRRAVHAGLWPLLLVWLASCIHAPPPGIGEEISWDELPGWYADAVSGAWPALLAGCGVLPARDAAWRAICDEAQRLVEPDDQTARAFFEHHFAPHVVYSQSGTPDGLITGYYEPLLHGSRTRTERFRLPVYGRPDDLLTIELGELYPELRGKRVRGRLEGKRVVPYYSRSQIERSTPPAAKPVVWVDDAVALFFLHIQGSGRVQLTDGSMLYLGYADQNGHPYRSIGRALIDAGVLTPENVSMQSIREWLVANPDQASALLNSNPSYVFFEERTHTLPGPLGSLNVPLYAERAVAIDPTFIPLGLPVWIDTTLPDSEQPYRRLMFAHDTGGAIRGSVRADVFFGFGETAESIAGRMKQPGRLYVLLPRQQVQ